jgi:ketosteroid isomerase-like protein
MEPLDIVRRLFAAIAGSDLRLLGELYADDAEQVEYPNSLLATGARRNKAQILQAAERGRAVMAEQRLDITHALVQGESVALEATWRGRLAVDVPALRRFAGEWMSAHFAQFLVLRDGRVLRHSTYDCFNPWNEDRSSARGTPSQGAA